jgi:DNA-binding IclR family transcriptional regulator
MSLPHQPHDAGYSSLNRGLQILRLVQEAGRLRVAEIARRLDIPTSSVYRYVITLRESGFLIDVDGYIVPSARLAEHGDESSHLVRYAEPVLRRLRDQTTMSAILAVRIHTAAVCLEASFAHPKHKISFQRGQVRALNAGGSALPLLAFAPQSVVRDVLKAEIRPYTAATPNRREIEREIEHVRTAGYSVSYGHLTPGMAAVGVPVIVDGRCLCSLSLVGEAPFATPVEEVVQLLREGARELLARIPTSVAKEAWLTPEDESSTGSPS